MIARILYALASLTVHLAGRLSILGMAFHAYARAWERVNQ